MRRSGLMLAGLKIRTPPDPATVAIFKALGAFVREVVTRADETRGQG